MNLFQIPNSPNWYFYAFLNGKRIRKSTKTADRKLAEQIADKYLKKYERAGTAESNIKLSAWCDLYVKHLTDSRKAENTILLYRRALKGFLDFIGDLPVNNYRREHLENYKDHRRAKWQATTVNLEIRAIKTAFNRAVDLNILEVNPFDRVKQFTVPKSQKRKFLTEEEIARLLKKTEHTELGSFIRLCLFTGCRSMSALALRWENIDFGLRTITFRNKPDNSENYTVPMNQDVFDLLSSLDKVDPIFPYTRSWTTHAVKKIFRKLKFPENLIQHSLRHTFASHLAMKGISMKILADLLGQSRERTAELYSHLDSTTLQKAVSLLNFGLLTSQLDEEE